MAKAPDLQQTIEDARTAAEQTHQAAIENRRLADLSYERMRESRRAIERADALIAELRAKLPLGNSN